MNIATQLKISRIATPATLSAVTKAIAKQKPAEHAFGDAITGVKGRTVAGIAARYGRQNILDAQELARKAHLLRQSDMPSDRAEAYDMIRQAADKIRQNHPEVAEYLDESARRFRNTDPAVKQYQEFIDVGASKEQANQWAKKMYPDPPKQNFEAVYFAAARSALEQL